MSNYDYTGSSSSRLDLWDMLSVLALIVTVFLGIYFVMVYMFPSSPLNFLNPNPVNPNATATPTITPIQLPPTWTATIAITGTEAPTLVPTLTLEASPTSLSLVTPSKTLSPTAAPKRPFSATVTYIDSTIFHPDTGCNWQGVAGTVVDSKNADMPGKVILLAGMYNGKSKNEPTVSGVAASYGKSGFEFFLGTVPIASKGELYLQLLDQAGLPLSDQVFIDTYNDCGRNLALVHFKENP